MESKNPMESQVFSSKSGLVVKRFKQWMEKNAVGADMFASDEAIKEALSKNRLLLPGVTPEEVLSELKKTGVVVLPSKPKSPSPAPIKIETEYAKLGGIKTVNDPAIQKQLEENKFFEELEKDVFRSGELDAVYERSLLLGKENSIEKDEYYYDFADAGLIKRGREEVREDLQSLAERQEIFKTSDKGQEKNKKIATIVERAIAHSVSEVGWYGRNVSIEPTSRFDDVKRGVDDILQIEKEEAESKFLGLGIDVTYRGLLSEKYKEKFVKLTRSIKDGYKTKIKYFKDHAGRRMEEFSVPKIVLYFNVNDVKDLVHMVKNADDPAFMAEFKNNPMKFDVLNQIMIQCELLAGFAEESKNDISLKYREIASTIQELGQKNPEIKKILDSRHEDDVSLHLKYLIKEFKANQDQGMSAMARAA